jgi:hypothetical protein
VGSACGTAHQTKVFLLLFLQKKKALTGSPFSRADEKTFSQETGEFIGGGAQGAAGCGAKGTRS